MFNPFSTGVYLSASAKTTISSRVFFTYRCELWRRDAERAVKVTETLKAAGGSNKKAT